MENDNENLYHRQRDIFDPLSIRQMRVHVIGCGTIGSWTTLALHKLGIEDVVLWDFDEVETVNVPSQNFDSDHVGHNKAISLALRYGYVSHSIEFDYQLVQDMEYKQSIFILAVDSLEARRNILASLPPHAIVIDGRMSGEGYEVHVNSADSIKVPAEASEDVCTAKGIIYVSMGIAAEIAYAVKQIMLDKPLDYKIIYRDYQGGNTLKIK